MSEIPDERLIINEILRRKSARNDLIPAEKMGVFKAKLNEEIQRRGGLSKDYVDKLLRQLKDGEL